MSDQDHLTREKALGEFLESLREQLSRFPDVEILVPDDETLFALAAGAGASSPRMRCFRMFPSGRRICFPS